MALSSRIIHQEHAAEVLGVPGRFHNVELWEATGERFDRKFASQEWTSTTRSIGDNLFMSVKMQFDDSCKNGHNTFAITADIRKKTRNGMREYAGGCLHDDIAKHFTELSPLIKWHLTSTDGPMHYLANTIYHAGDRDHRGLRLGEKKPLIHGRTKKPCWELVAITGGRRGRGVRISDTDMGRKYIGADTVPLWLLTKDATNDEPPVTPVLKWQMCMITGEGKARKLDYARSTAVWPEATDAELSVEPEELKAKLVARLPQLLADFKAAMLSVGFKWEA